MNKKIIRIVSVILSLILIYFLFSFIDVKKFISNLRNADPLYYGIAFLLYAFAYLIRALRLWELFGRKNLYRYTIFISIHQVLNRVMPFRTGEIFFPILIKKLAGNNYTEGVSKLIILRLLDLISLFLVFLIFCLFIDFGFTPNQFGVIIGLLIFLIVFLFKAKSLMAWLVNAMSRIAPAKYKVRLANAATPVVHAFNINFKQYFNLVILSMADKVLNYLMCYFVLLSLGYNFSVYKIVSANSLSGITEILPVNSLGSFGTTELGWAGALIFFGENPETAIASGFGFNIMAFSFTLGLGLIGLLLALFHLKINFKSEEKFTFPIND